MMPLIQLRGTYLKLENKQVTGSYKQRGAMHALAHYKPKEVVCSSAGNHGLGVAYAAKQLGLPATIFMPTTAVRKKAEGIRSFGAQVYLRGDCFDQTSIYAQKYAQERDAFFLHPFNDAKVIEGQGFVGRELREQLKTIDHLFVPVGGGGLAAGIAQALPNVHLIGVEPKGAASMEYALKQGKPTALKTIATRADGCAVKCVGELPFQLLKNRIEMLMVSEEELAQAMQELHEEKIFAELSGALAYAGSKKMALPGINVCIVSGGNYD